MNDMSAGILNICFMPPHLPDELLYSLLGRVAKLNVLGTPRRCAQQLFGSSNIIPSPDLPTRLQVLQMRLGSNSPFLSAVELIETGTLYPYHRPFLPPARDSAILNILLHGGGKGLKALLGRLANRFGANPDLRFCIDCVERDIAAHGTSYWHRSHQLPGVTACHEHKTNLFDQKLLNMMDTKQCLISPPLCIPLPSRRQSALPQQVDFALLSKELLEKRLAAQDPLRRKYVYEEAAMAMGLCKRGRVDHSALTLELRRHYNDFDSFLHRARLLSTDISPLAWTRPLFEKPGRSSHPICHLLLIGFLFGTLSNFLGSMESSSVLVPQATESKISVATERDSRGSELYRDITLSCREVARRLGISVTSVVTHRRALGVEVSPRHKYLNDEWRNRVATCLRDGMTIAQVASMCKVSLSTVYRVRAERGEIAQPSLLNNFQKEQEKRRQQWDSVLEIHHDSGVKVARAAAPAAYAWLRRNDRIWLQWSCQGFRKNRLVQLRVDWEKRDLELCERVQTFVSTLKSASTRPRMSKSLLVRQVGEALLRVNQQRLPRLVALLDILEESVFAYELRRLDVAIEHLRQAGERLVTWRIQRAAGVKIWTDTHTVYTRWKIKKIESGCYCSPK